MIRNSGKTIAVIGAAGHQGGGVVRALKASGAFRVRAVTRNPSKYSGLADEVAGADLNRPETLWAAFKGAHGVFAVTNAYEPVGDRIALANKVAGGRPTDFATWARSNMPAKKDLLT